VPNIKTEQSVGMAGYFTIKKFDENGEQNGQWEFKNLILNQGLDRIATNGDYLYYCYVGSGNATPAVTDTTLQSQIASVYDSSNGTYGNNGVSPYYWWRKKTYAFGQGVAAGNISEIGIGWVGNALFSRALILDEFGNPTSITILSNELLTVDYEIRVYPKLTDDIGTVVFTGSKGGSYDWIFRTASANSIDWVSSYIPYAYINFTSTGHDDRHASGDIGSVTSVPSGIVDTNTIPTIQPYVPGSYESVATTSFSISQANFAGGVRSLYIIRGFGMYQIQFDPAIPKEDTDTLSITYTIKWGRI